MTALTMRCLVVVLGVAALPAAAQTPEDWLANWEAGASAEAEKPLDALVPEAELLPGEDTTGLEGWDTVAAPMAEPATEAEMAEMADLFGEAGATAAPVAGAAPVVAAVPADWVRYQPLGAQVQLPPDWVLAGEESRQAMYFKGDAATHEGTYFGIGFDGHPDNLLANSGPVETLPDVTMGEGLVFHRVAMSQELQPGMMGEMQVLYSDKPLWDEDHLLITMLVAGGSFADHAATYEMILSSFVPPEPPAAPEVAAEAILRGMIPMVMPEGFAVLQGSAQQDYYSLNNASYDRFFYFGIGEEVSGSSGLRADIPAGVEGVADTLMGYPALRYDSVGAEANVYSNGQWIKPHSKTWIFDQCSPEGLAIGVSAIGAAEYVDGDEPAAWLNSLSFTAPLGPCGAVAPALPEEPVAGGVAPAPDTPQAGQTAVAPEPPAAPVTGQHAEVGGVTFTIPADWAASSNTPDDKVFTSPDGRFTVIAFWWVPDEPLTGYSDVVAVEQLTLAGVPVTKITSSFPESRAIQVVTDLTRADGMKFIFAVDHNGTDEAALAALQAQLVAGLRFDGVFAENAQPQPMPQTGPQPEGQAAEVGGVRFAVPADWRAEANETGDKLYTSPDERFFVIGFWTKLDAPLTGYADAPGVAQVVVAGHPGTLITQTTAESISMNLVMAETRADGMQFTLGVDGKGSNAAAVEALYTQVIDSLRFDGVFAAARPATVPAPPSPPGQGAEGGEPDSFTDQGGGYTLYQNARYGTFISYPGSYFVADAPPGNGDGRHFTASDGQAEFMVFAQYNAMGQATADLAEEAKSLGGYDRVTYEKVGAGWYVLSGYRGDRIFYRRGIDEGPDGLVQVFEISYPAARKAEFDPVVSYMADSFGPGTSVEPAATVTLGPVYRPEKDAPERKALLKAANASIKATLEQKVKLQPKGIRTDGTWAYMRVVPTKADGKPINWSKTAFAELGGKGDVVVMLLLKQDSGEWAVVDYKVGAEKDDWTMWAESFGLPEILFHE